MRAPIRGTNEDRLSIGGNSESRGMGQRPLQDRHHGRAPAGNGTREMGRSIKKRHEQKKKYRREKLAYNLFGKSSWV